MSTLDLQALVSFFSPFTKPSAFVNGISLSLSYDFSHSSKEPHILYISWRYDGEFYPINGYTIEDIGKGLRLVNEEGVLYFETLSDLVVFLKHKIEKI